MEYFLFIKYDMAIMVNESILQEQVIINQMSVVKQKVYVNY